MRKKCLVTLVVGLLGVLVLGGCSTTSTNSTMGKVTPKAMELQKLDYKVLGTTTAQAKVKKLFGLIELEGPDKNYAALKGLPTGGGAAGALMSQLSGLTGKLSMFTGSNLKSAVNYMAIQKVPNADRLLDPYYETVVDKGLFMETTTIKVKAKAIQYTGSAR